MFRDIINSVRAANPAPNTLLLVVTNPVDVLTYLAVAELGWPREKTVGLGTVLDTQRFLSLLGERMGVVPAELTGCVLGEHGDSMVPIYSSLRYQGRPVKEVRGYSETMALEAFEAARTAGAECLRLKGGAGYAVGVAIRQVVEALLGTTEHVLPVSTVHSGDAYGDVAFSLPTRLARPGFLGYAEVHHDAPGSRRRRAQRGGAAGDVGEFAGSRPNKTMRSLNCRAGMSRSEAEGIPAKLHLHSYHLRIFISPWYGHSSARSTSFARTGFARTYSHFCS